MDYKSQLNMSIPTELLKKIDVERGEEKRSHFITKVLISHIEVSEQINKEALESHNS